MSLLLLVQLALPLKAGDARGTAELLARSMAQVAGLGRVHVVLEPDDDDGVGTEIHIETAERRYGTIRAEVQDAAVWAAYEPFVQNLAHVVAVHLENLRQRRELEQALADLAARTEALALSNHELEAFAYSVSHDLRAPLRAIDGHVAIVLEEDGAALTEAGRGHLGRVRLAAGRMAAIIDDLLRLTNVTREALRLDDIDVADIADEVIATLRAAEPSRAVTFTSDAPIPAHGDARLVRLLLENLLGNAWKFSSTRPDAHIELHTERDDDGTWIVVRDNGVGFDMAYAARLFAPFERLHGFEEFPGTGIGLAIVERVVRRHGGTITASSEVGRGATFRFSLG